MKITHNKETRNLFAISISFDSNRGLIGFDFFTHSILISLYNRKEN